MLQKKHYIKKTMSNVWRDKHKKSDIDKTRHFQVCRRAIKNDTAKEIKRALEGAK